MRLLTYIKILRPINLLITFVSVWGGVIIAKETFFTGDYLRIFLAAFAASLIAGAGNVINDYFDIEVDKANNKLRPLVTGEITPKQALYYYFALNIIAFLILALFVSESLFYFALSISVVLFLYSWQIKLFPFVGNVIIGLLTGFVFIYAGMLTENWYYDLVPFMFASEINFLREVVKDIEDIEGDTKNGYFTMAIILGETFTKFVAVSFTFILIFSTFLPYLYLNYSPLYLYSIIIFVDIPLLFFVYKIIQKNTDYKTIHLIFKTVMIFGLVSIILGVLT